MCLNQLLTKQSFLKISMALQRHTSRLTTLSQKQGGEDALRFRVWVHDEKRDPHHHSAICKGQGLPHRPARVITLPPPTPPCGLAG